MQIQDVSIKDSEIRLGQFIKLANLVATGGEAKEAIATGIVTVTEEPEVRRGRTLISGDVVCVTPASRTRAAADNAAAPSRRVLG